MGADLIRGKFSDEEGGLYGVVSVDLKGSFSVPPGLFAEGRPSSEDCGDSVDAGSVHSIRWRERSGVFFI